MTRATLYRYYNEAGVLLYVGQTSRGRMRGSAHARNAPWWKHVSHGEFHEVDREFIDLAERLAIWVERPLFNVSRRVSTSQRQVMLARLAEVEAAYGDTLITASEAGAITGLTVGEIRLAVRWGFLESERVREAWFTAEQLGRFIGTTDDGPADPSKVVGYPTGSLRPRSK